MIFKEISLSSFTLPPRWSRLNVDKLYHISYKKGENIINQDCEIEYIYYMLSGKAGAVNEGADGDSLIFDYIYPGDVFGELEMIIERPATVSVKALKATCCIAIPVSDYKKSLLESISMLWELTTLVASRNYINITNSSKNILESTRKRLARYIIKSKKNGMFNENLTNLSEHLGVSYRHLLRTLKEFCNVGILKKEINGYILLDEDKLKLIIDD